MAIILRALLSHVEQAHYTSCWTLPELLSQSPVAPLGSPPAEAANGVHPSVLANGNGVHNPTAAAADAGLAEDSRLSNSLALSSYGGSDSSQPGVQFEVAGMWPYWMHPHKADTITNSFSMDSIFLLTGEVASNALGEGIIACLSAANGALALPGVSHCAGLQLAAILALWHSDF